MAKKEEVTECLEIKDVCFDFDNVIAICLKRGVLKSDKSIKAEIGYTGPGFEKLKERAPRVLGMLYTFLKENDLKFEDIIKECPVVN